MCNFAIILKNSQTMNIRRIAPSKFFLATVLLAIAGVAAAFAQSSTATEADTTLWATPNVSVTNLRMTNDYDAGMETQALLGMPMKVLQKDGWLQVMTPDDDKAWVLPSTVKTMTVAEMHAWNTAPQVVVTAIHAFVYSAPDCSSQPVSDVVASCRLKMTGKKKGFYGVEYPDGRKGWISSADAQPVDKWRKTLKKDAQSIIATAHKMVGAPYMWGGTSTKGVDCSGFVRTTLLMHDIIIPRNASQQAYKGQHIEIAPDFGNLIPGDLVFFGRKATEEKKAHVSHVGIYIGDKKFIHSLGFVKVASFNPDDADYDAYDLNRLLWAQRVLPYINVEAGMNTTDNNEYYK